MKTKKLFLSVTGAILIGSMVWTSAAPTASGGAASGSQSGSKSFGTPVVPNNANNNNGSANQNNGVNPNNNGSANMPGNPNAMQPNVGTQVTNMPNISGQNIAGQNTNYQQPYTNRYQPYTNMPPQ